MSESGSLTPSQVMSTCSSHSSSGGGSIGGYVVVDKCSEHLQNSDSYEEGKSSEIPSKSENLVQAGSTAVPQDELVERVQNLTKENEELKGVIHQNSKLLEVMFMPKKGSVEIEAVLLVNVCVPSIWSCVYGAYGIFLLRKLHVVVFGLFHCPWKKTSELCSLNS